VSAARAGTRKNGGHGGLGEVPFNAETQRAQRSQRKESTIVSEVSTAPVNSVLAIRFRGLGTGGWSVRTFMQAVSVAGLIGLLALSVAAFACAGEPASTM
jgi:hypothetical protein